MKKLIIFKLLIFNGLSLFSQLTITVNSIPSGVVLSDKIYIAGTFNQWNPSDEKLVLKKQKNGTFKITFTPSVGTHNFKFTRGSWQTVEGSLQNGFIPNRTLIYSDRKMNISIKIDGWEVKMPPNGSTASENVSIMSTDFDMPQLGRKRKIWVYLPPQYRRDLESRFPVLYMQDAQNLFDKSTSFSGEWQVDETLDKLSTQGSKNCIVVGIDNGGDRRLEEYSAWRNPQYGGGEGRKYAQFVVETLKPYIDSHYRTQSDRGHTGIGGSSLGGLISMYIADNYQETFSKAVIFSPAFWFNDSCYANVQRVGKKQPMKYYFMAGQNESQNLVSEINKMTAILRGIGYSENDIKTVIKQDGQHAEWFWAREFEGAYKWLFSDN